ncbi:hypothetical protein AB840_15400 [Megasphaera cerevisiae DSM 20462]|uniref:Uncharacterized protein n=1 Tax=Megasphaera cerevisiae DSM 20462 TaxID=1122219 RepID=A0A0J6WP24_9FIRM|nr:hypothetical protein AB840_15400 [Megasphaera cerevisiae DSM 20462]
MPIIIMNPCIVLELAYVVPKRKEADPLLTAVPHDAAGIEVLPPKCIAPTYMVVVTCKGNVTVAS